MKLNTSILFILMLGLTGCAAIADKSSATQSYEPEYGYVTSAYSYPGYHYYPSRPSFFETHGRQNKK